uniref:Uncharacterized protein n=1 Tax=Arundo donax TaxID=35708 RepID=A0A0A8YDE6_ARUDO
MHDLHLVASHRLMLLLGPHSSMDSRRMVTGWRLWYNLG